MPDPARGAQQLDRADKRGRDADQDVLHALVRRGGFRARRQGVRHAAQAPQDEPGAHRDGPPARVHQQQQQRDRDGSNTADAMRSDRGQFHVQMLARRSRKALPITDTELNVMAALAIIGLRRSPAIG